MERAERHHRRSIRLKGYDYTQNGAYFVTVCTHGRTHAFGAVIGAEMRLNEYGREVANCWTWLEEQYQYVYIDVWIVMPDHTHAIIVIENVHHNGATHDGSNATNPNIAHRDVTNTNHPTTYRPWYGDRGWVGRQYVRFGNRHDATQTVGTFDRRFQNRVHETYQRPQRHTRWAIVATQLPRTRNPQQLIFARLSSLHRQ